MLCVYTYVSIPVEPMHVDVCAPGCVCECVCGGGDEWYVFTHMQEYL